MILVPFGDLHLGYNCFNLEKAEKVVEFIEQKEAYWLGMGDYIDNTPPSHRYYITGRATMTVQEEVFAFVDLIEPIKDRCIGLLYGNHEVRTLREEFDPVLQIAKMIGKIELAKGYTYAFDFAGRKIFAAHGNTSSSTKSYRIKKLLDLANLSDADVYLMGHVHEIDHFRDAIMTAEGLKERLFVFTGSFVEYKNSYAEEKLLKPTPTGCNALFFGEKMIEVKRIV